jgi:protein-S-isoprenylcysteine O-methyltransferase Ste14
MRLRDIVLWMRGLVFTALAPLVVAGWLPAAVDPFRRARAGAWMAGWVLVAAGAAIYGACLIRFLAAGGTPAIFFTRPLRGLIGEAPPRLVDAWLYQFSRNPMYLGVVLAVVGQAIAFASLPTAQYALFLWFMFHIVVIVLEEPHLRERFGPAYDEYCHRVPRWLGPPSS